MKRQLKEGKENEKVVTYDSRVLQRNREGSIAKGLNSSGDKNDLVLNVELCGDVNKTSTQPLESRSESCHDAGNQKYTDGQRSDKRENVNTTGKHCGQKEIFDEDKKKKWENGDRKSDMMDKQEEIRKRHKSIKSEDTDKRRNSDKQEN